MIEKIKFFIPEILILLFAIVTRFINLGYPKGHIFDEVYHAFTAQELFKGNPAAWEWWNTPPQGFAYEWTHPPLAKEFMTAAIFIFGDSSFAWRFFSALFGVGVIVLIYFLTLELFKNRRIAILASLVATLDGLILVMSRIAMNDIYFVFFSLLAILMFVKKKYFIMALALGLAVSSKWTGVFTIGIIISLFIVRNFKNHINVAKFFKFFATILIVPFCIYLLSYVPFFMQKHIPPLQNYSSNMQTFVELQQQMWWYHTNLKATHSYQSNPLDWILNLRPVWIYVDNKESKVANIYTLDNPIIPIIGFLSIIYLALNLRKSFPKALVVISYFLFFILWIKSPRIMFNYHYLASTVFLTIALGFSINELFERKYKLIAYSVLVIMFFLFIYFYPFWTGIHLETEFAKAHFWLNSWK